MVQPPNSMHYRINIDIQAIPLCTNLINKSLFYLAMVSFCLFLLPIPSIVMAMNYTEKVGNQTINITIQPPVNKITTEPVNITQLAETIEEKQPKWTQGDILIASSTIFAFFGFGSFLVIRFQSRTRITELIQSAQVILASIGGIQIFHLIVIGSIVQGSFSKDFYGITILSTALFIVISLIHVAKIIDIENKDRTNISDEVVENLQGELIKHGVIKENLEKRVSDLERENRKLKYESGEY